ncbi:MAG TPA: hypothetical protein VK970_10965 [Candidatus Methylacidiphilales bacterium]|nr:hypothetical protein [Candidatus Methylacidiphilales bacterium]
MTAQPASSTNAPAASPSPRASAPQFAVRDFSMLISLVCIWAYFGVMSPEYLSSRNLTNLAIELSITATLALGMLMVILPGYIDLSAGSGVGLLGGVASVLVYEQGLPAPVAMAIALVLGVAIWLGMGSLIVTQSIPAFIITLGGLLIFKGVFWRVIHNATIPVINPTDGGANLYSMLTTYNLPGWAGWALAIVVILAMALLTMQSRERRRSLGLPMEDTEMAFLKVFIAAQLTILFVVVMNQFRGIPVSAVILGAAAVSVHVLTKHTAFGRYLYAIGGNEQAAFISGIPVKRVVIIAYGLMGGIVALTGLMRTAFAGSSTTTVGDLMELDAIAACVIGGASLKGGRGTVGGVLFGALLMASLINGMTLMSFEQETKFIARGIVLVLAVWMDVKLSAPAR